ILGEGAYGKVHPARVKSTGEKVCLDCLMHLCADMQSETDALVRIYDNGGHPNISGLRDMYEDNNHYYLILDLIPGGEMFDHLIKYGQYSEEDASRLVQEILSALAFLHNIGVVHADLKPENILLCSKKKGAETVKIIDFGCAKIRQTIPASTGTRAYWAPEAFQKDVQTTEAIDIWSVGVILYIMLVGAHPFDIKGIASDEEIEERIKKRPIPPMSPALTSHLTPSARDFIKCLMAADPNDRLTALAALQHPWIRGET
ncbi:calcium-dependent protein kinase, partial [Thalassiosira pseudonana CCMP1335]